jgi:hypothetical protein
MSWSITVDGRCDARAQVNQRRWKWWYKNTFLDETHKKKSHGVRSGEPGGQRSLCGHAPLLLPLSTDVQSIFVCKCNPCLEIVNTTSELPYHWVGLSQILSKNAVERTRQTCLHEHQEHRTIYVLHSSPFSLAGRQWNQRKKKKLWEFTYQSTLSQQDTLIRFRIISYWNRDTFWTYLHSATQSRTSQFVLGLTGNAETAVALVVADTLRSLQRDSSTRKRVHVTWVSSEFRRRQFLIPP